MTQRRSDDDHDDVMDDHWRNMKEEDDDDEEKEARDCSPLLGGNADVRRTFSAYYTKYDDGNDDSDGNDDDLKRRRCRRYRRRRCRSPPKFLSLDFDRIVNFYSIAAVRARNASKKLSPRARRSLSSSSSSSSSSSCRSSDNDGESNVGGRRIPQAAAAVTSDLGFTVSRWALTFLVGLCTGLTAVCIIYCVEAIVDFRSTWLNEHMQWAVASMATSPHDQGEERQRQLPHYGGTLLRSMGVCALYGTYNLILVLASSSFVVFLSPEAAGSGIPEVKAYLNGVRVGLFDDWHLFWTKLVGTILSVSSGLVVGPEGPVVHLGAILGAVLTKAGDWTARWTSGVAVPTTAPATSSSSMDGAYEQIDSDASDDDFDKRPHRPRDAPRASNVVDAERKEDKKKENTKIVRSGCCSAIGSGAFSSLLYYLSHLRNDLERRHLISVGAAAGFASAFGAPVGGLLYSMEEASSFFAHDMLWRTLFGTVVATCCIAVYHGDFTRYCMLSLEIGGTGAGQVRGEGGGSLLSSFEEVPLYVVMGAAGGLLGTVFNSSYECVNRARKRWYDGIMSDANRNEWRAKKRYAAFKLAECCAVSVLTSGVMLGLSFCSSWACRPIGGEGGHDGEQQFDQEFRHRYNCAPGEINEIGSILFGSREESIRDILTDPEEFDPKTLLAVGLTFLLLMIVTFGMAIPQGMFMPTVLTGASLGGYAGLVFKANVVESVHPSDFAIIGAAAFLAGMQRNTVSLCVILMEGTGQTKAIIPVIITVVSARFVGDLLSDGIYEIGMELKGYPYLLHNDRGRYDMFSAEDVMSTNFDTLATVETAGAIEALLLQSDHHAFPVVEGDTGEYKGMVRRDQLIAALQCKVYVETMDGTGTTSTAAPKATARDAAGPFRLGTNKDANRWEYLDDGSAGGGAEMTPLEAGHRRYSSARRLPRLDDDVYESQRNVVRVREQIQRPNREWEPGRPELVSPWLRDNVLTSDGGDEVLFGLDETLPSGRLRTNTKAVVRLVGDKFVAFVSPENKDMHVHVGRIMNRSALSVLAEFPLSKTYDLFVSMGLRHLPVLGKEKKVIGMITRYHLLEEHVRKKTGYHLY